ncbi:hypothetical protein E1286_30050 [Nonomuraea terrae]|uniref:Uncharacterized protein n=1 Tax=Nonomuraea terrae TaxID=2530383 RepID=A0A4R4YDK7_9ACTN|nr:hypothetical protein [Nonomuraea terrae]TDD42765.1 hypothetical protein E1286_30050 [Nonomuraea terrae]
MPRLGSVHDAQEHVHALGLQRLRAVREEKERDDPDDFGGMSLGNMILMFVLVALSRPWETLRALVKLALGLGARAGRRLLDLVLLPFRWAALIVWSRWADRRPTFEDFLHGDEEDRDPS